MPTSPLHMSSSALTQIRGPSGRPILSEDDVASPPDAKVIQACEQVMKAQSQKNGAVIASDVAAKAGVSLSQARRDLSTIATLTGGDIAVSQDGELLYTFPSNIRGVMSSNSKRFQALQLWEKAWPRLFYGIRVSMGVLLFVSIFAIFSTIFLVFSASGSSDRDDRDNRRGGGGGMGMGYGMNNLMLDMLFPRWGFGYSPFYGYYGRVPYATRYYGGTSILNEAKEQEPNLFERIFSYIFGDGDPNYGIDNARLRAAAELIRSSGGAVVAEQLAPFVDAPSPDDSYVAGDGEMSTSPVDESFVLPIVTQLGGVPTVTDDGDIVYVFEELQLSAENTLEAAGLPPDAASGDIVSFLTDRGVSTRGAMEKSDLIQLLDQSLTSSRSRQQDPTDPLQEMEVKFNRNGAGWNALAGTLGAVNLGGALYLGALLPQLAAQGIRLPSYFGLVQAGYPLLLAYAVLYNVIPAVRYLSNKAKNQQIRDRNAARQKWSTVLRSMGGKVRRKIRAARNFRTGMRRLGRSDSVYDTQQDARQLEAQREGDALKAFDELLKDQNSFQ